ncbi:UNVERIFIED_CONTAM: hypothetical protein RMT77_006361 [Armadillidium vulgare]
MISRRKVKRIILILFITLMALKIHKDYLELSNDNEKLLKDLFPSLNQSSQISIMTLHNIQDITQYDKASDKTNFSKVTNGQTRTQQSNVSNSEEQNVVESNDDNRVHYVPSFKKKMEEAILNGKKLDPIPTGSIKPNSDSQKTKEPQSVGANVNKTVETVNKGASATTKPVKNAQILRANSQKLLSISASKRKALSNNKPQSKKPKKTVYKVSHVVDTNEISLNQSQIVRIKNVTRELNERQHIYNLEKYGPLAFDDAVIVIQVHNRLANLKYLVESLTNVKHINKSLVIFSHDYWDDEINHFVRSISAFKVMQIFFPFSIQLNPLTYPGRDPRDCLWNEKEVKKHVPANCLNVKWPDSFGHYREASFTQIKHHWWWKLVQIFDKIRVLKEYPSPVLFLEEDHYVFPDILHVLRLLVEESNRKFPSANVFCLGNYQKQIAGNSHLMEKGDWLVNKYNLGFAFNRTVYNIIKSCERSFCSYDDYNWDWTLNYVATTCVPKRLSTISVKFSRVLHMGTCGTHVKKQQCNLANEGAAAKQKLKALSPRLFPNSITVQRTARKAVKPKKSNGGWGDLRDKRLCLAISNGSQDIQTVLNNLQFSHIKMGEIAS